MQFKLNNGYLWLVLLLGLMGMSSCESNKKLASFEGVKHKGVCWVGSRHPLQGGELRSLQNLGVSHLSQTPFGAYQYLEASYLGAGILAWGNRNDQ